MKREILNKVAAFYDVRKDFDYYNTKLASRIISPYSEGKIVLEVAQ